MYFLKKILLFAIIGTVVYYLMSYHYIVVDKSVKMLKKSEFTLKYTFFSTKGRSIESILTIKDLWDDGIGQMLLDEGKITEAQLSMYKSKMEKDSEE